MEKKEILEEKIFTISDVFSAEECQQFIMKTESIGYDEAPITTAGGFVMRKDVRNNTRSMFDDYPIVETIWERVKPFIPETIDNVWRTVGLNERIRCYKYDVGQYFAWHYDGSFRRSEKERSLLTFMIYLNDKFEGGETNFSLKYPYEEASIKPKKGMAAIFEHHLLHEGASVTKGRKYVLRSDVMYRVD
jgi:predicted 2-oxoglutarate/Fe(II)-dependent dioxygenase YbiX